VGSDPASRHRPPHHHNVLNDSDPQNVIKADGNRIHTCGVLSVT